MTKTCSIAFAALVWASAAMAADDVVVDAAQIAAQAVGSKGANCPSSKVELDGTPPAAVFTVEASPETSFDFGKIELPLEVEISPRAVVIVDAEIDLADQSYLEVGLQLEDGRYFFDNIKQGAAASGAHEMRIADMASADGKPFGDAPARTSRLSLMVNSDASIAPGTSKIRIGRIVIVP